MQMAFATSTSDRGGEEETKKEMSTCVVCGDESDGLHFGQFTCRACAAFFRRTVSLKLHYTCKRAGDCDVDKAARNMCRACRYKKCIQQGMLTSAVQHARDGIGKRAWSTQRDSKMSTSSTEAADVKMARPAVPTSTMMVSSSAAAPFGIQPQQQQFLTSPTYGGSTSHQSTPTSSSNLLLEQATAATILQLNAASQFGPFQQHPQHYEGANPPMIPPYIVGNFSNLQLGQQQQMAPVQQQVAVEPCSSSGIIELKHLRKMMDGYHHFLSLRKASYTLVDGFPLSRRDNEDCPQSNFGTSKKICKIEASLILDIVEKFFTPFYQLPADDKNKLFDPFYCLFSNAERAFRTYKMFSEDDDRLLMPDGGYVRLSELQKFYENNTLVRGDPSQVARIFENAMYYLVKTVVAHMRNIELSEMELIALFGMFIWSDSEEVTPETLQTALRVRNEIIVDLHLHYRTQGLSEAEVTLKIANLFLLIPKLENSMRLFREDQNIAELFNMVGNNGNATFDEIEEWKRRMRLMDEQCSREGAQQQPLCTAVVDIVQNHALLESAPTTAA